MTLTWHGGEILLGCLPQEVELFNGSVAQKKCQNESRIFSRNGCRSCKKCRCTRNDITFTTRLIQGLEDLIYLVDKDKGLHLQDFFWVRHKYQCQVNPMPIWINLEKQNRTISMQALHQGYLFCCFLIFLASAFFMVCVSSFFIFIFLRFFLQRALPKESIILSFCV